MNLAATRRRRAAQSSEADRRRVALRLRDELAQSLAATRMQVLSIRAELPPGTDRLAARLDQVAGQMHALAAEALEAGAALRPPALDDLGLQAALEWLARDLHRRTGAECAASTHGTADRRGHGATMAFRLAQRAAEDLASMGAVRLAIRVDTFRSFLRIRISVQPPVESMHPCAALEGVKDLGSIYGARVKVLSGEWPAAALDIRLPAFDEAP